MKRTLIAVFDNRGDAQNAVEELVLSGFPRQDIRLSEGDPTGRDSPITGASTPEPASTGSGITDSIRTFLTNIFGTDNSVYVQKYSDAVTRGHHVLTMTTADEPEVERAAAIVERYGPVDIDEKVAEWSGGPVTGEAIRMGMGGQQQSAQMSQQSAQGSMQGGGGSGSEQRAIIPEGPGAVPPAARSPVKVFSHLAEPSLSDLSEEDELYYRSHYNANYAGSGAGNLYDEYAPAYRYGSKMASDETYRGQLWKDVEPALRSEWEADNPGTAWGKFKAAVRHGWDRITHLH